VWRQIIKRKTEGILRVALIAIIFVLISSVPTVAAAADDGVIEGQVINRTADGSSVADIEISLTTFTNDVEGDTTTVQTDADGNFEFDTLATASENSYQITFTFQDEDYISSPAPFDTDETTKTVDINVYDTTSSNESLSIVMSYSIIRTEQSIFSISEYYQIVNSGDTLYIGTTEVTDDGDKETLRFTLPTEATGVQYGTGLMEDYTFETEDGFISTIPVSPGGTEIIYSYHIIPEAGTNSYDFSRKFHLPVTGGYSLLVQDTIGIKASSNQLTLGEPLNMDGTIFKNLADIDIPADTVITTSLSLGATSDGNADVMWMAIGLVVVAGGFGGGYVLKKRRSLRSAVLPVATAQNSGDKKQQLLLEIVRLDDEFANGNISKEEHHKLRADKKGHLVELIRKPKVDSYGE
jgi:5-hydroxyisourate hydrolase-like protein (transthyretin family)